MDGSRLGGVRSQNSPSREMFIKASANNNEGGVDRYDPVDMTQAKGDTLPVGGGEDAYAIS